MEDDEDDDDEEEEELLFFLYSCASSSSFSLPSPSSSCLPCLPPLLLASFGAPRGGSRRVCVFS